jgi:hypothetical protein
MTTASGQTAPVPNPPDLSGPRIYLESSALASTNTADTPALSSYIPLFEIIPTNNVPYGFVLSYQPNEMENNAIHFDQPTSVANIDIKLSDEHGNTLVLPETTFPDLLFRVHYNALLS